MNKTEILRYLKENKEKFSKRQMKTIRGQALAGDVAGAEKGLKRIAGSDGGCFRGRRQSMNNDLMFSSKTDLWSTPQDFFDELNREFHFTLDACALPENAKCARYFTPEMDGLAQEWSGIVWCNPPYGRSIGKWVQKAAESEATVVMLLPARTDTKWFHDYIYKKAETRFVRGRLKFGGCRYNAPFPSMVVVFRKEEDDER